MLCCFLAQGLVFFLRVAPPGTPDLLYSLCACSLHLHRAAVEMAK
jgi:thiamine transporter ThiT